MPRESCYDGSISHKATTRLPRMAYPAETTITMLSINKTTLTALATVALQSRLALGFSSVPQISSWSHGKGACFVLLALSLSFHNAHSFVQPHANVKLINTPLTAASSPLFRKPALFDTTITADAATSTKPAATDAPDDGPQLGAWLPLGSAASLTGLAPVQIRVCGLDLAVWHKPLPKSAKKGAVATEWSVMVDACPHRLAPLSQGRVDPDSGCIECPYHGWAFDTDGSLKTLPQLDEGLKMDVVTKRNVDATSLPVHAAGDLLFVFLPTDITGESWPITHLPENHYPYLKDRMDMGTTYYSRDLPYSIDFLLENFMDPAHIPFAHHSLQGTRDDGSPVEMKVLANNFTHVESTFVDICRGKQRDGIISFQRPSFVHFRTRVNETAEYTPNLLIYCTPVEVGKCRVIMPDFSLGFLPRWLGHIGSNRFLNSDAWLHNAERTARMNMDTINKKYGSVAVGAAKDGRGPLNDLNYVFATVSDTGPNLFRKWWSKHGFADSPPNTFGAATASSLPKEPLTRQQQIDPWHSHAINCASCRKALKQMRLLQKISVAGAAIGAIIMRRKPPFAITLVFAAMYAHEFLRKLATTIEGNNQKGEIDGRSVAAIK